MSVTQCHAFSIVNPKVGSSACIVRSTLTISCFYPMLNDNLYPSGSCGKHIYTCEQIFQRNEYALLLCILVHHAVTCARSHITLAPILTQTLKYIHRELLTGLKKTTHSEKAEGSNPATGFPPDYKSSNNNSRMTKQN